MNVFKKLVDTFFNGLSNPPQPNTVAPDSTPIIYTNTINSPFSIPGSAADSITGSALANKLMNSLPDQNRENAILAEYTKGNVPTFLRHPVEITVSSGTNRITYQVLPDYLCVGTDEDFIRTPMNPLTARKIADLYGATLPTTRMVNQIWKAATIKVEPKPNGPPYNSYQQSIAAILENETAIKEQTEHMLLGKLLAGHKKDVVITSRLVNNSWPVAIYGWHYLNGKVIQDLNTTHHDKSYKDYSHGIRLVSRRVVVNGKDMDLFDVLKDRNLCSLISDEGSYDATKLYTK